MSTDQLIRTLTADLAHPRVGLTRPVLGGAALGLALAAVAFAALLGPRVDIGAAANDPRFLLKHVVMLALAAAAAGLLLRLLQPGSRKAAWALALLVGPLVLATGVFVDLFSFPSTAWGERMVGHSAGICLISIPLLAAPILTALMLAMRHGAPTRPAVTGSIAGLLAGSLGGALYAAHCLDDSPLFVCLWYGIAISGVCIAGALLGPRVLRW